VQATARKLADEQIIIALGVTLAGQKIPLGFVQAATENERKNVESYLPKSEQSRIRRKMEAAYSKPTYEGAKKALDALKPGTDEPVCPQQSRGGHGRNADAASIGTDVDAQPILHRIKGCRHLPGTACPQRWIRCG